MPVPVPREIQTAVDQCIRLYRDLKRIETQMDELRDVIKPFMRNHGLSEITASDGSGRVALLSQERPVMNARYTLYDVDQIAPLLPPALRKKCLVEVVDKERLEALCKLGEVPEDVLNYKLTKSTLAFSVKLEHDAVDRDR